jgi:23S rRNA-/tRNA-specific pseudouridylate synthase
VTLAELGHPIVGDRIYGSERSLDRHLLHATDIDIEGFTAHSNLPPEIENA